MICSCLTRGNTSCWHTCQGQPYKHSCTSVAAMPFADVCLGACCFGVVKLGPYIKHNPISIDILCKLYGLAQRCEDELNRINLSSISSILCCPALFWR